MKRIGRSFARWGSLFVFLLMINGAFIYVATDNVSALTDGDYVYTLGLSKGGTVATITGYTGAGGWVTIPSTMGASDYPVRAIGAEAFRNKDTLTEVTIPNSVTSVRERAFYDCDALNYVSIPTSVTNIGTSAFERCEELDNVAIPDGVKTIGDYAFFNCDDMYYATIGSGVTTIGDYAFGYCNSLSEIRVSEDNSNYASDNGILYNKAMTTLICCPGGKSGSLTIPSSVTSIEGAAFQMCHLLTSVTIPNSVTSIGGAAFYNCDSLTNVNIPDGITTIEVLTFYHCSDLNTITIPYGVTSILDDAFNSCTSMTSVTIPASVTTIGDWAFKLCSSLTSITFYGLVAPINVGGDWIQDTNTGIRGHAYATSNFPPPGGVWNGLTMGTVIPPALPKVPTGLTVTPRDAHVSLSWTAPTDNGGAVIDHYVVYQNGLDVLHVSGTSTTVTGLTNGVSYNFAVAAHNSAGTGPMTPVVSTVPTLPLTMSAPDAPTGLTTTPGDGQVQLSWTAPADNGGAAIDYYVVYRNGLDVLHVSGTSTTVTGLTNGVSYNFAVAAHNSAGTGEMSTVVSATPAATATNPGAPTELNATAGDGQVLLSWNPPANNGGTAVTGYLIYWGTDPSSSDGPISTTGTSYLHEGLENGQVLYYRVSAVNAVGEGDPSEIASATPSGSLSLPSAPTGLTASIINDNVSLNWTAPADGALDTVGFRVYRGASVPTMQMIASVVGTTFMDNTVTGNQTYYYQVSAVNDAGEGERSGEVNVTLTSSSTTGTSSSFLDTIEGQLAIAGLAIVGVAGAGYLLWRRKRK